MRRFAAAVVVVSLATTSMFAGEALKADVSGERKAAAIFVRFVHDLFVLTFISIAAWIVWSIFAKKRYDIAALFTLNAIMIAFILSFLVYKRCALSILYERILKFPDCHPYLSPIALLLGRANRKITCEQMREMWIWDALPRVAIVFVLNCAFAIHAMNSKKCQ